MTLKKLAQMQAPELAFVFLSGCPGSSFLCTGVPACPTAFWLFSDFFFTGKKSSETENKQIKNCGWKMPIYLVVIVQLLRIYACYAADDQGRERSRQNTKEQVVLLAVIEYTEWLTVPNQKCHLYMPVQPVPLYACPVFPTQDSAIFVQLLTCQRHLDCNLRASAERLMQASFAFPQVINC